MRTRWSALVAIFALGCSGNTFNYNGFQTYRYVGLDGERSWAYVLDDNSLDWRLKVDKSLEETRNGTTVYALDYGREVTETQEYQLLYTIWWSSDANNGVQIHEIADERDGKTSLAFSTPITIAEPQMLAGESVTTETDGLTIVSTFESQGSCPNDWISGTPWDCLNFDISDGTDDDSSLPIVGRWELAVDYGPSRFQQPSFNAEWVLSTAVWIDE